MMKAKSYYHNELMANRGSGVIKLLPRFWKTKSFCGSGLIQSVKTGARFPGRDTQKRNKKGHNQASGHGRSYGIRAFAPDQNVRYLQ
jgi:hypothetical protein